MATLGSRHSLFDQIDPKAHPVWSDRFSTDLREQQITDDLFAGRSVTGVLFAVVLLGTLLMAVTVGICLW